MRNDWDMVFLTSARDALEKMRLEPFDVVLTELRMAEMDAPEFLRQVMAEHPGTVRLVLSGHGDETLISRCAGVSHQFIAKPCDPEFLKFIVNQTGTLGDSLVNQAVVKFAAGIDHLPALPPLYRDLCSKLEADFVSTEELGRIIEKDPGMTSAILKVANSSYFGLRRKVVSATDAALCLGSETLKGLILQAGLFEGLGRFESTSFNVHHLWAHTTQVARTARKIAVLAGAPGRVQDACFTGGLLHDAGILVMGTRFPEEYQKVSELIRKEKIMLASAEHEIFGVSHGEVGAYLLGLWGLPEEIIRPVAWHHVPNFEASRGFSPTVAVHLADAFAGGRGYHLVFGTAKVDDLYLESIGLGSTSAQWRETLSI